MIKQKCKYYRPQRKAPPAASQRLTSASSFAFSICNTFKVRTALIKEKEKESFFTLWSYESRVIAPLLEITARASPALAI